MTKPIFLKNGVWGKVPVENPDEIRYVEFPMFYMEVENLPLDVDLDLLVKKYNDGHSVAGSCGIKPTYKYTHWASGMRHGKYCEQEVITEECEEVK